MYGFAKRILLAAKRPNITPQAHRFPQGYITSEGHITKKGPVDHRRVLFARSYRGMLPRTRPSRFLFSKSSRASRTYSLVSAGSMTQSTYPWEAAT